MPDIATALTCGLGSPDWPCDENTWYCSACLLAFLCQTRKFVYGIAVCFWNRDWYRRTPGSYLFALGLASSSLYLHRLQTESPCSHRWFGNLEESCLLWHTDHFGRAPHTSPRTSWIVSTALLTWLRLSWGAAGVCGLGEPACISLDW